MAAAITCENQKSFVLSALAEGHRLDSRGKMEMRPVSISFMADYGSVDVSLGKTRILATVSAEAVLPFPDRPTEGLLQFKCEFTSMAFPEVLASSSKQNDLEIVVNRTLEKVLRTSRAVDTEGLCIVASQLVWSIVVDLKPLSFDGNLMDCACIAAITALTHFRRPDVTVTGDGDVSIHPITARHPIPLSIHHVPICTSFSFFGNDDNDFILDPSREEELVQLGSLTISMNAQREVCCISKIGGKPLQMETIAHCCQLSFDRVTEISEFIKKQVGADLALREPKTSFKSKK